MPCLLAHTTTVRWWCFYRPDRVRHWSCWPIGRGLIVVMAGRWTASLPIIVSSPSWPCLSESGHSLGRPMACIIWRLVRTVFLASRLGSLSILIHSSKSSRSKSVSTMLVNAIGCAVYCRLNALCGRFPVWIRSVGYKPCYMLLCRACIHQ